MKWLSSGVLPAKIQQLQYSAATRCWFLTAWQHYMCSRYLALCKLKQCWLQGSAARNTRLSNGGVLAGTVPLHSHGPSLYIVAQLGYNEISFQLTPNVNTKVYNVKIVQRYESNVPRIKVARTKTTKG